MAIFMGRHSASDASKWGIHLERDVRSVICMTCSKDGDLQDNPVLTTNGEPAVMNDIDDVPGFTTHFRSYPSIHDDKTRPKGIITKDYKIVLHHYMSRSMEDFITHKLKRATGRQSSGYASAPGQDPWDPEVMKAHEDQVGMRGDAEVCKVVAHGTYAERCCRP
jgi:hypothetical protein